MEEGNQLLPRLALFFEEPSTIVVALIFIKQLHTGFHVWIRLKKQKPIQGINIFEELIIKLVIWILRIPNTMKGRSDFLDTFFSQ